MEYVLKAGSWGGVTTWLYLDDPQIFFANLFLVVGGYLLGVASNMRKKEIKRLWNYFSSRR